MIVKQVRLSSTASDKLSRLKGKTGIKNWNVLARWAFCFSLKEGSIPASIDISHDDGVEMTWQTFIGEGGIAYEMLLINWCQENHIDTDPDTLAKYFYLHLERGIGYLSGTKFITSIDDLLELAFGE